MALYQLFIQQNHSSLGYVVPFAMFHTFIVIWQTCCYELVSLKKKIRCLQVQVLQVIYRQSFLSVSLSSWFLKFVILTIMITISIVQSCVEPKYDVHPLHPFPNPPLRTGHPLEAQAQLRRGHLSAGKEAFQGRYINTTYPLGNIDQCLLIIIIRQGFPKKDIIDNFCHKLPDASSPLFCSDFSPHFLKNEFLSYKTDI